MNTPVYVRREAKDQLPLGTSLTLGVFYKTLSHPRNTRAFDT